MVGWHHQLDGHEFEQALGVGDGQGGLGCCGPWGRKESDTTGRLNCTWVSVAVCGHSLAEVRGSRLPPRHGRLPVGFLSCRAQALGLSSFRSRSALAYVLCGLWDLPRPGIKPLSPALAGRFPSTGPPGKPL